MTSFFKWYGSQPLNSTPNSLGFAQRVWEAAALAERERVLDIIASMHHRDKSFSFNDALLEVADAIRNP